MRKVLFTLFLLVSLFSWGQIDSSFYENARLVNQNVYSNNYINPDEYDVAETRGGLILYSEQVKYRQRIRQALTI